MTNSPFYDPQRNPLPDANDIEQDAASNLEPSSFQKANDTRRPSPHIQQDIRWMRNMLIRLLVIGAVIGCVLGVAIAIFLKRTGLADPPEPIQRGQQELYQSQLGCSIFANCSHKLMVTPEPNSSISFSSRRGRKYSS